MKHSEVSIHSGMHSSMSNTRKYAFAIHNLYEADDKFMVHNSYFDPFIVV